MNQLVDTALKLHQEAENARREAITALLEDWRTIASQLKALGHVEGQKSTSKTSVADLSGKVCRVCKEVGHDGRYHRSDKDKLRLPPNASASA